MTEGAATTALCPRCAVNRFTPYGTNDVPRGQYEWAPPPALSRADNETYICSPCGQDEAMLDFTGEAPSLPSEWPISRTVIQVEPGWDEEPQNQGPEGGVEFPLTPPPDPYFEVTLRATSGALVRVEVQAADEADVRGTVTDLHPELEIVNVIPSRWRS